MLIDKAVETAPQTQQTENGQTESAIKPVSETAPITVDFERLQEENKDIIAWLYCPDTEINYPVVQSKDNEYYLRRPLGKKNQENYTWVINELLNGYFAND